MGWNDDSLDKDSERLARTVSLGVLFAICIALGFACVIVRVIWSLV